MISFNQQLALDTGDLVHKAARANRLKHLRIDEVSSVDRAANQHARIVLTKRADAMTPEQALLDSLQSGLDDDTIADKEKRAFVNQQVTDYQAHVAKRVVVSFKKGSSDMDVSNQTLVAIAKNVLSHGASPVYEKHVYIGAIAKLADEIKKVGESTAQAFTRAITQNEAGRVLYQTMRLAKGSEVPDGALDKPHGMPWGKPQIPAWEGPAHAKFRAMAQDHLRANPRKSPEGAFAHVYTDPANAELRQQAIAEHHNAILAAQNEPRLGVVG